MTHILNLSTPSFHLSSHIITKKKLQKLTILPALIQGANAKTLTLYYVFSIQRSIVQYAFYNFKFQHSQKNTIGDLEELFLACNIGLGKDRIIVRDKSFYTLFELYKTIYNANIDYFPMNWHTTQTTIAFHSSAPIYWKLSFFFFYFLLFVSLFIKSLIFYYEINLQNHDAWLPQTSFTIPNLVFEPQVGISKFKWDRGQNM